MRFLPFFREFITELANCDKLVVGAVFGFVNGLGVAMLPYFDFVYASDTSTFCLPYANLGQTTEGGLALAAKCSNIPDALVMSNHYVKYLKKSISPSPFAFTVSPNANRRHPHHSTQGGSLWFGVRILSAK